MHERVYGEVRSATALLLAAGHNVVVDAVHGRAEERKGIEAVARDAGAQFAGPWLQAPLEVLEARLAARKADASDATAEVMRAQLQAVSVPDDWRRVDASLSAEDSLARASQASPQARPSPGLSPRRPYRPTGTVSDRYGLAIQCDCHGFHSSHG